MIHIDMINLLKGGVVILIVLDIDDLIFQSEIDSKTHSEK